MRFRYLLFKLLFFEAITVWICLSLLIVILVKDDLLFEKYLTHCLLMLLLVIFWRESCKVKVLAKVREEANLLYFTVQLNIIHFYEWEFMNIFRRVRTNYDYILLFWVEDSWDWDIIWRWMIKVVFNRYWREAYQLNVWWRPCWVDIEDFVIEMLDVL